MSSERPFRKALFYVPPVVAATAILLTPDVSRAIATAEPKRIVVSFADLDLASPHGNEVFNRRIQRAAEAVCADLDSRELADRMRYQDCLRDATQRALADVRRVRK